jgi:hypothetical protein
MHEVTAGQLLCMHDQHESAIMQDGPLGGPPPPPLEQAKAMAAVPANANRNDVENESFILRPLHT